MNSNTEGFTEILADAIFRIRRRMARDPAYAEGGEHYPATLAMLTVRLRFFDYWTEEPKPRPIPTPEDLKREMELGRPGHERFLLEQEEKSKQESHQ